MKKLKVAGFWPKILPNRIRHTSDRISPVVALFGVEYRNSGAKSKISKIFFDNV